MNQIDVINNLISYMKNNNLSSDEIYTSLAAFGINNDIFNNKIINLKYFIQEKIISHLKTNFNSSYFNIHNQENSFTHISLRLNKKNFKGPRSFIKLYISFEYEYIKKIVPLIYKFLIDNRIDFSFKISQTVRNDIFVIRVNNKKDAEKIINFCKNDFIKHYLTNTNPFLPNISKVGVAKDTLDISYNGFISKILYQYISQNRNVDEQNLSKDFENFIIKSYWNATNSKERFMYKIAYQSMNAINNNFNILDYTKENFDYKFDYEMLQQYKRYYTNGIYIYEKFRKKYDIDSEFKIYLSLQANNCLLKMFEENSDNINPKLCLNEIICNQISTDIDYILDRNFQNFDIAFDFKNFKTYTLLPYLYADFAIKYKDISEQEARKIINFVKRNLKFQNNLKNGKLL